MYLNLIEIAESFGVSEKVVEDWIRKEGLPHTADRGRLLFDRAQVAHWAASRGLASHAGFLAAGGPVVSATWRLESLLRAGGIWRDVPSASLLDVLERIITAIPGATPPIRDLIVKRMRAPNGVTFAPVGGGFALPHPSLRVTLNRQSGLVAVLFLRDPLRPREPIPDDVPLTRLLFFIAPSPRAHLDILGRLSRLLAGSPVRGLLLRGAPDAEILAAVAAADAPAQEGPEGGA